MARFKHNHRTRLNSGAIKRKTILDDSSDLSSNPCSSSSDDDDDDDDDDNANNNQKNNILAKDKLAYYKFLNKLFPSNYTASQINKIKKQRLNNNYDDNHDNHDNYHNYDNYNQKQNNNIRTNDYFNSFSDKKNNLNIVFNIKDSKNTIYNNDNNNNNDPYFIDYDPNNTVIMDINNNNHNDNNDNDDNNDDDDNDDNDDYNADIDIDDNNENVIIKQNNNTDETTPQTHSKNKSIQNYRKFSKILNDDDKESEYFKKNMSNSQQENAIAKLLNIKKLTSIETPYLIHLINIDIPDVYKACALRKIHMLREMGTGFGNSEYYKIKSWVDAFIKIPFNKYNNLPITFADGIEKCHDFMENAKNTLDNVVYGLEEAKMQIMQLIGLWLVNPNAIASAIAIKGPPGTGKTSLIKDGISKILNRPFSLVALGGCSDSGFLDGHDYTYEGSKYGKIIDILIQSGAMNPVILFDELDKISNSPKGEELTGVLTHLTDSTQNNNFTDKYMSEISLDMSKALYIFSYNDESKVNSILKDRMYKIETQGYKTKDKLIICKDYLLPKIQLQTKFDPKDIIFTDDVLEYIINNFTDKESGVRNLKRCIEIIYTKLNLYRLMKPEQNIFEKSINIDKKVIFPYKIKTETIDKLLNKTNKNEIPFGMYN